MRLSYKIFIGTATVCLLGSCTERRTDSVPEADGDTVEVVISQADSTDTLESTYQLQDHQQ